MPSKSTIHHETPVLVVGGGPVGLILSLQLARFGINCMLTERNLDTTKWPKMDCTNCRSMELFKRLGIASDFREIAVPPEYSFDVICATGLSDDGEEVARWKQDSVDAWRQRISEQNDGSLPREPYQRCSQAVLEAWLKPRIQDEEFIDGHFGLKFESFTETDDGVKSILTDVTTGDQHIVHSKYLVGCDGAGSRVRRSAGIDLVGGPVPAAMMLIHFKSRDLTKLHKLGQFWHIMFANGSFLISQDEIDTWTLHVPIAIGADWEKIDPIEAIHRGLGTPSTPYPIKVDKILVKSAWRPNICVAERYASTSKRIFLAGDSAHQNIPTGGYGMNTGIGDSFDLGWKIAATLKGYGGKALLESYELERLPVATRNIDQSGAFWEVWRQIWDWSTDAGAAVLLSQSTEGKALKAKMANWILTNNSENKAHGIELGYRYNASPIVVPDTEVAEPRWDLDHYIPSTWPGARPPHVFLSDGHTSIFDLFGQDYTIVDFSEEGAWADAFVDASLQLKVPLHKVHLPKEKHVRAIWERNAVLVRPDDHVAWRAPLSEKTPWVEAMDALKIAVGQTSNTDIGAAIDYKNKVLGDIHKKGFSGTVGNTNQEEVAMKAVFQK